MAWRTEWILKSYDEDYKLSCDDDDHYPANYHQSHYHQVGFCHNDEGWEYDTVNYLLAEYFPMAGIELTICFKGNQVKNVKGNPPEHLKKFKIT